MSVDVREQLRPVGAGRAHRRRRRPTCGSAAYGVGAGVSLPESPPSVLAVAGRGGSRRGRACQSPRARCDRPPATGPRSRTVLVQPDAWTPGTDEKGPPGRLAVVARRRATDRARRITSTASWGSRPRPGSTGSSTCPVRCRTRRACSAPTSPWCSRRTVDRSPTGSGTRPPPGVAVYDTATGALKRMPIASAKGSRPGGAGRGCPRTP